MATLESLRLRSAELTANVEAAYKAIEDSDEATEAQEAAFKDASDKLEKNKQDIAEALNRHARMEEFRKRAAEGDQIAPPVRLPTHDKENRRHRFDTMKAIRCQLTGQPYDGIEGECHSELVRERSADTKGFIVPHDIAYASGMVAPRFRAMDTSTASNFVSQPNMLPIVEALRAAIAITQIGVRTIPAGGKFNLPTAGKATVYHVDGTSPTASDPVPGGVAFDLRTIAAKTKISRKLLISSDVGIQSYVWDTLVTDLGVGLQAGCLTGSGSSGEPTGLFTLASGPNIYTMAGANGQALVLADLLSMTGAVAVANAQGGEAWLLSPKLASKLEGTPKVSGQPVFLLDPASQTIIGRPYLATSSVPDNRVKGSSGATLSALAFGCWRYAVLALFSGVDVFVNPYTDDGGVTISAFQDYDFGLTRPTAFSVCKEAVGS